MRGRYSVGQALPPQHSCCSTSGRSTDPWEFELGSLRGGAGTSLTDLPSGRRKAPVLVLAKAAGAEAPISSKLRVVRVQGDGRCMFRALAKGFARNAGFHLAGDEETLSADELRGAVSDALCHDTARRQHYSAAMPGVNSEGGLSKYCQRLDSPKFWGGEVELLVLSKMVSTPIYIYRTAQEAGLDAKQRQGFVTMVSYGEDYEKQGRKPVRLLYRGGNHYDLLLD